MIQNVHYGYNPSIHDFNDMVSKYNNACRVVHERGEIIRYLEEKLNVLEDEKKKNSESKKILKRCRFHNSGFCKKLDKCLFQHPSEICQDHLSF